MNTKQILRILLVLGAMVTTARIYTFDFNRRYGPNSHRFHAPFYFKRRKRSDKQRARTCQRNDGAQVEQSTEK